MDRRESIANPYSPGFPREDLAILNMEAIARYKKYSKERCNTNRDIPMVIHNTSVVGNSHEFSNNNL